MNTTQTLLTRTARTHRNLELLATVATPATSLWDMACSRCHPIQKVATTGNTHLRFNIRALSYCQNRLVAMLDSAERFINAERPELEPAPENVEADKKSGVPAKSVVLVRKIIGGV